MSSIFFNNLDSMDDLNLKIENIPAFPSTNAKYETVEIPGGENGSLNIFDGYSDNQIAFNFRFKAEEDFILRKSKIIAWLNSKISSELVYSGHKSIYYLAKKVSLSEFKTTSKFIRRFTATFALDPFTYLSEGKDILEIVKPITVFNGNSTYASRPHINIYGTGDIIISINSQSLILKGLDGNVEIDSFQKNCYKTINNSIVNQNNKMYSQFPILEVGENNISWSGNVSKIEIIPRWCCL